MLIKKKGNFTRINVLIDVHRLCALGGFLWGLCRKALAHFAEAPVVHGALQGVAFPSESSVVSQSTTPQRGTSLTHSRHAANSRVCAWSAIFTQPFPKSDSLIPRTPNKRLRPILGPQLPVIELRRLPTISKTPHPPTQPLLTSHCTSNITCGTLTG